MQTLYMHVGLHKTGTTALQKFFHDNMARFAIRGLVYPRTGLIPNDRSSFGHHELAWSLRKGGGDELWHALRRELHAASSAVVSSEEFEFLRQAKFYQTIRDVFPDWRIRCVCYLRRQDELVESEYNQYIKDGAGTSNLSDFMRRMASRLDYSKFLDTLASMFGQENIIVRPYRRRAFTGDIYSDFLRAISFADSPDYLRPVGVINPGINPRGIKLLRRLNQRFREDPAKLRILRRAVVNRYRLGVFNKHGLLSDDERRLLLARYRESNARLAVEYLDGERLFEELEDEVV